MKRSLCIIIAVVICFSTIFSVSFAAGVTDRKYVDTPYGKVTAELFSNKYILGGNTRGKFVVGETRCANRAPRLITNVEVYKYTTGKKLYNEDRDLRNVLYSRVEIETDRFYGAYNDTFYNTPITIYGSHELRSQRAYGAYTSLIGV